MTKKKIMMILLIITVILCVGIGSYATYSYLASDIQYTKSDGTQVSVESALNELYTTYKRKPKVGDLVSYSPSGSYSWDSTYTGDTSSSPTLKSGTGTGTQDMSITSWKVLAVRGDEVDLVPSAPTTNTVYLYGANGYNNAVKLLNDACSSLYGNGSTIRARSINMEDIEGLCSTSALNTAKSSAGWTADANGVYKPVQKYSAYSTSNSKYPNIYAKEDLGTIDNVTTYGMDMSAQSAFFTGSTAAGTSIRPYHTYYYMSNSRFTSALGDNAGLILPSGSGTNYWVASRCVSASSSFCNFRVRIVNSGGLDSYNVFISNGNETSSSRPLFPVVSLSSKLLKVNGEAGFKVE